MNTQTAHFSARIAKNAVLIACLCGGLPARADFGGTPVTLETDGGWCWFQDPRAIILNGHLVIGSVAGTTVGGVSAGGDEKVTDYNMATGASSRFTLKAAYNQDDHASPAFAVLPDNRILVTYTSHGGSNYNQWRVSANPGNGISWGPEQVSTVNTTNDGNGNTYNNPFYLSVPNTVYDFSRAIGYDTNYSKFTGINPTDNSGMTNVANFSYGGHLLYWKNPAGGTLATGTGGNGRPYVKYASNGTDTIWFATTEDSPQSYLNSLYAGYVKFSGTGVGTAYLTTGTALGPISTGTAPTTATANQGAVASGAGYSYPPTQFTPIVKANTNFNGYDLSATSPFGAGYAPWGSSMCLDSTGNPCLVFVVMRNTNGAYGNNMEYGYARLVNGSWKASRIGYAGWGLYSSQNQYAGLAAVDPLDVNKVYLSANVDPVTGIALQAPDGNRHYQIFKGATTDGGATWTWTQLTNTNSENLRPVIATGGGQAALLWMQGSYASYVNYNTNIVGIVPPETVPVIHFTTPTRSPIVMTGTGSKLRVAASVTEYNYTGAFTTQWLMVSGPGAAVFTDAGSADTTVRFPQTGTYVLQFSASDGTQTSSARFTVVANSATQDSALALWLKLDETGGTVVADASGAGNSGTANAVVWQNPGGMIDGAAQFGASGSTVTVPDAATLDSTSAFTLSYWFKANAIVDSAGFVSKRVAGYDNNAYTTFMKSDGLLYVDIDRTSVNPNRFTSARVFTTGTWYHVAVVFDGSLASAQRGSIYVNGALDNTGTITSTTIPNSTAPVVLGNAGGSSAIFNGLIDDVRFYRRAFSAAEVQVLANGAPVPGVSCGAAPPVVSGVAAALSGVAGDNGGGAVTIAWTKVSGPGTVTFGNLQSPATIATFSQAGSYVLQLSGRNAAGQVMDTLVVNVAANPHVYQDWIVLAYPGATGQNVIGALADPDRDGIANLCEFALGMDPTSNDASSWAPGKAGLPVPSWVAESGSTYLSLQVRRPIGLIGIAYSAEVSDDLVNWSGATLTSSAQPNGDGSETLTFRDNAARTQAARHFIRLAVSQP